MLALVFRRLLHALAVVALAATVTFALLHAAPGDPIAATLDHPTVSESVRAAWRAKYGLDRPASEQFVRYVGAAVRGDLGWSFTEQRPVREVLGDALPRSVLLVGTALLLSLVAGIALGAWQAWRPRARVARSLGGLAVALHAAPEFALGLALVTLFALKLALLPSGGIADPVLDSFAGPWERVVDRARHLVLPAVALALGWTAIVARHQRGALRDVADDDFVRTARAKGASERRVLFRHALRASLAPTVTLLGLALPALVGGAVVTESVFAWPGMGLVATRAVAARDYALVTGAVIVGSAAVALGSLLADVLVALVDPRQRERA
ncbi:ABC transporter permease [Roseisolibacter agri]|uniref:Peptide ABC transporter permease n=1 Tax=Roseisolibacter agri TaxID=2014610 RepID=A0AA37V724_9BACT|nr:ABC transporter permease [Roseisolibacter agri]GLC26051.1 peptide ABC transporter permease [Roseisolibacter agri]